MQENLAAHSDVLMVTPLNKIASECRFGMTPLIFHGVNSKTKNFICGVALVKPSSDLTESYEFVFKQFQKALDKRKRILIVSRQHTASGNNSQIYKSLLKVFGKCCGVHHSPTKGPTQILFCPYDLLEELKDKFSFLQKDERFLYNIILNLPFEIDREEVCQNITELIRLDFKQLENLRELLMKLNTSKQQWSRSFLLQRDNSFTGDLSLNQRSEILQTTINPIFFKEEQSINVQEFLTKIHNFERQDFIYTHEIKTSEYRAAATRFEFQTLHLNFVTEYTGLEEGATNEKIKEILSNLQQQMPRFSKQIQLRFRSVILKTQACNLVDYKILDG